ncbi:MAG: SpoIIE family protein phosphatase [candidate division Zixibacteria bacterium]|nr:SpoIIE family protein phosphatase [candidate division Zixibacteria bacterium]
MSRVLKESTAFFKSRPEELSALRQFMLSALWELSLPVKEQSALWLAVEEAATNVIRHAYLFGEGPLRLTVRTAREYVEFSLYDRGRRLELAEGERLDLSRLVETGRKGGLGLYLIEKIMDEVGYLSRGEENEFRMRKHLKGSTFPQRARFSLRAKVSVFGTVLLTALVLGSYFVAHRKLSQTITANFEQKLEDLAGGLASAAAEGLFNQNDLILSSLTAKTRQDHPELTSLVIADRGGKVWADPFGPWQLLSVYEPPPQVSAGPAGVPRRFTITEDPVQSKTGHPAETRYYMAQKIYSGTSWLGTVHLSASTAGLDAELAQARSFLVQICLSVFLFGGLSVWVLGAYLSRPFQRLTEGLRRVREGESRVPAMGKDEFGEIARAVNEITAYFKKSRKELLEQEKLRREMELAQEVQRALLPAEFPKIEGMEVAVWYQSAREVGGDFFDFFPAGKGLLGIAVADVSGKGVPGALGMATVRTALRLEAKGKTSPAEILCRVNRLASEGIARGMFVTVFLALLDAEKRTLFFSSAGHLPMLLYRAEEKKAFSYNPPGLPVGLALPEGASFEERIKTEKIALEKGDFFLLYTDGLVEAADSRGSRFGREQLVRLVEDSAGLSAEALISRLKTELAAFVGGGGWGDDVTAVVVKDKAVAAENIIEGFGNGASENRMGARTVKVETKTADRKYSLQPPEET